MRVLLDTNVLVRILSRREAVIALRRDVAEKNITLISSGHILSEVETVLSDKLGLTKQKAKVATRLLERQSTIVTPGIVKKVCRDPFDDYVLAAAIAGKAKYLVTEDKDLLVLGGYEGIKIVTNAEFRAIVEKV